MLIGSMEIILSILVGFMDFEVFEGRDRFFSRSFRRGFNVFMVSFEV